MSIGIDFLGVTGSTTVNESYSRSISQATENTYTRDYRVNVNLKCQNVKSGDPGVGLYQWVTETNTGKSKTFLPETVCRYGAAYFNKAPACPYPACKDGECKTCDPKWKK